MIRIVHANGKVEEISETHVKAAEIMKLYPKHVLKKPSTSYSSEEGVICPKIVVVPPDAELQRGKIYFLMPIPASSTEKTRSRPSTTTKKKKTRSSLPQAHDHGNIGRNNGNSNSNSNNLMVSNDQYLSEILSEKISTQRDRRRGRVGVWRPHLESISETSSDQP